MPPPIEHSTRAATQALFPAHRRTLDFFAGSLADFQASDAAFRVVCTQRPPVRGGGGPLQALQNRIVLAPQQQTQSSSSSPHPEPVPPRVRPGALVVLDASFNPPTAAHAHMARVAVRDYLRRRDAKKAATTAADGPTRLLLVLGVANADKGVAPAALEQRLSMMWALAGDLRRGLQEDDKEEADGEGVSIDVCLSRQPFFHEKSAAIALSEFYLQGVTGDGNGGKEPEQAFLVGYDTLVRILNPKYYGTTAEQGSGGQAPIRAALGSFFGRARLLVTMRADAEWGDEAVQKAYVEALARGDGLDGVGGRREWAERIELVRGQKGEGGAAVSSTLAREAARQKDWDKLGGLVTPSVKRWVENEALYAEG